MKFDDADGIVPGVASCLRSKQNERKIEREREKICKFRTEGRGFSRETVGRTERRIGGRGEENESEVEKKSATSKGMHEARRKLLNMRKMHVYMKRK